MRTIKKYLIIKGNEMKILWATNIILPDVADSLGMQQIASGGWLTYFLELLSLDDKVDVSVLSVYRGDSYKEIALNKVKYYLIPVSRFEFLFGTKKTDKILCEIVEKENPDLIHIHGMEFPFGLQILDLFPDKKIVVNIQTIADGLYQQRNGGIGLHDRMANLSFREIMELKGPVMRKIFSKRRVKNELVYLKKAKFFIGNTFYDYSYLNNVGDNLKYFYCPYLYRKIFYTPRKWDETQIEKFSIFTGQAAAPLKGLHILIKALFYLKQEIPDAKLYIPGPDLSSSYFIKHYSYAKYINKLIHRYDLKENVVFLGQLSPEEMADRMRKSNVVVVPSAMELGSSMVWEAMLIGTPVIAAFRGGMVENFVHGESGFYYDFGEVFMLKEYIHRIFCDSELANKMSLNEIKRATELHDPISCKNNFVNVYEEIINEEMK